jgi:protein-S-isoprenylcysteine O-methyltransferase Ste14
MERYGISRSPVTGEDWMELYEGITITTILSLVVLLLGWVAWIFGRRGQERLRGQLDLQRRLLDKFSSAPEFVTFTETESGRRFLENLSTEHGVHAQWILSSIRKGVVLTLLGVGLCTLPAFERDLQPLAFFGVIALALGIGFLISAWASYRLSRSWGLLPPSA